MFRRGACLPSCKGLLMIPLRDLNPTRHFPLVTITLIGLNVLVYFYELSLQAVSQQTLERFFYIAGMVPYQITNGVDTPPPNIVPIYLTILTAMFMHGGWLHLGSNMLYLWIFGNNIEDVMGTTRYLVFYLLCGLGAAALQIFVNPASRIPAIGASGAIAGVLGGYILLYPQAQIETLVFFIFIQIVRVPAIILLGYWILIQLFSGVLSLGMPDVGGVAYFAHIGGFISGLALVRFFRRW